MKNISSTPKERKYKTDICSSKARAFPVYTERRLAVPDDISESNVHEMLQPLENHLKVLTQFEEKTNILGAEFHAKKYFNETEEYEVSGFELLVKWTNKEIGDSVWQAGWFLTEVQGSSLASDWVKVEYKSERGHIYKIEVMTAFANNTLKMRGSLY